MQIVGERECVVENETEARAEGEVVWVHAVLPRDAARTEGDKVDVDKARRVEAGRRFIV